MADWTGAMADLHGGALGLAVVSGPLALALAIDLVRLTASEISRRVRWRRILPASPLPRDSVLRGDTRGSEGEEWLAMLAQEVCKKKWRLHPKQLPRRSLDALRRVAVRMMRRPEHRSRFQAHFQMPAWELLGAGDLEVEQRILQACGELRRRPLWATGRLTNILTLGYLGISPAMAYVGLDLERMRRDFNYFERESMTFVVSQLGWLDGKIQRWRLGQGAIGLLHQRAELASAPAADGLGPTTDSPGSSIVAEALALLDDVDFWVGKEAEEQALAVLAAVEEAGRNHRDPAAVARAIGGLQRRLADLRAFEAWFEAHMDDDADHRCWPRALGLALADCGEPLTEEEFRLRAMQRFLTGPAGDREDSDLEPDEGATEASTTETADAPTLELVDEISTDIDHQRADSLF